MQFLTGDLGVTATYARREFRWVGGLGWPDGRDGSLWIERWTAKTRHGTKSWLSRYGVAEVKEVGFAGRAFVFDKDFPADEPESPNVPPPPYTVRVDPHGEVWCKCMAGQCKAPCCVHADAVLTLIDLGAFDHEIQGA